MQKLRKSLNRLKNDLYVFKLSKRLQKESQKGRTTSESAQLNEEGETHMSAQEAQNSSKGAEAGNSNVVDSDKMVSEQIQSTMEAISKMEASLTTELIF